MNTQEVSKFPKKAVVHAADLQAKSAAIPAGAPGGAALSAAASTLMRASDQVEASVLRVASAEGAFVSSQLGSALSVAPANAKPAAAGASLKLSDYPLIRAASKIMPKDLLPFGMEWAIVDLEGKKYWAAVPLAPKETSPPGTVWKLRSRHSILYWGFEYTNASRLNYSSYVIPDVSDAIANIDAASNDSLSSFLRGFPPEHQLAVRALLAHYWKRLDYPDWLYGPGGMKVDPRDYEGLIDQIMKATLPAGSTFDWRNGARDHSKYIFQNVKYMDLHGVSGNGIIKINGVSYGSIGTKVVVDGITYVVSALVSKPERGLWPVDLPLVKHTFGDVVDTYEYLETSEFAAYLSDHRDETNQWKRVTLGDHDLMGRKIKVIVGGTVANQIGGLHPIDAPYVPSPSSTVEQFRADFAEFASFITHHAVKPFVRAIHGTAQYWWSVGTGSAPSFQLIEDSTNKTMKTVDVFDAALWTVAITMVTPDLPKAIRSGSAADISFEVINTLLLIVPIVGFAGKSGKALLAVLSEDQIAALMKTYELAKSGLRADIALKELDLALKARKLLGDMQASEFWNAVTSRFDEVQTLRRAERGEAGARAALDGLSDSLATRFTSPADRLIELFRPEYAKLTLDQKIQVALGRQLAMAESANDAAVASSAAKEVAKKMLADYFDLHIEIDDAMVRMSRENGFALEGLEYSFKSPESLARKIDMVRRDLQLPETPEGFSIAAQKMRDLVRYTMITDADTYFAKAQQVIAEMESQGFRLAAKPTNSWYEGSPYLGLNMHFRNEAGLFVELQVHTAESFQLKTAAHVVYEARRLLPKGDPRALELQVMQNKINELSKPLYPQVPPLLSETFGVKR